MNGRPAMPAHVGQGAVKCLVWDLDGTLWNGTLLEGDTVTVADETRRVIAELDGRGVLQSVASRNAPEDAWSQLERLELEEYFVVPQIGWGRKSDAIREIARRLDFAEETIAFVDDQPLERAEVAFELPSVRCYEAAAIPTLPDLPEFTPRSVTADAFRRRSLYQARLRREQARSEFAGPDDAFLRSLELVLRLHAATDEEIDRVEELTLRTSQMNATGVHYSDPELRALLADPAHSIFVATMSDRFGDHGAIGVLLVEHREHVWHLKLLATSCRVMAFGAGGAILRWLLDAAARAGVHLVADFRPTSRNRIMEVTYRFAGFSNETCRACGDLLENDGDVQRLHVVPSRQSPPETMTLEAPELEAVREPR